MLIEIRSLSRQHQETCENSVSAWVYIHIYACSGVCVYMIHTYICIYASLLTQHASLRRRSDIAGLHGKRVYSLYACLV